MKVVGKSEDGSTVLFQASVTSDVRTIGFAWVIIELAPDGILVSDADGRIIRANKQIEALFGHAASDCSSASRSKRCSPHGYELP